ncbi:MAG: nuclear transport factor 2 family protein [Croceibacterium sp.]
MIKGFASCALALALAGCGIQQAREGLSKQDELLAKVAIEDRLNRYYQGFGTGDAAAFNEFYTEDAVFDVNGIVAEGKEEIEAIYAGTGEDAPAGQGTFHMIISNLVIDVQGNTATARMLWTGVDNNDLRGPPTIREQGREYDLLVRQDGQWLIKKRVVVADSGLPESMVATYDKRENYDITGE